MKKVAAKGAAITMPAKKRPRSHANRPIGLGFPIPEIISSGVLPFAMFHSSAMPTAPL
jgi:hypothetical protein